MLGAYLEACAGRSKAFEELFLSLFPPLDCAPNAIGALSDTSRGITNSGAYLEAASNVITLSYRVTGYRLRISLHARLRQAPFLF
ncbi:hypothetical protein Syun_025603 [Stephania yunnanensis]|uniref:Uncharacterized protein n=1 Tax=Stephania yunnanensis TaxID=152371 RepID=A0AAP0EZ45_9MAGN